MFSDRLRELRKQRNMSQSELAKLLYVSQQAVARWETDKATPNPETISKIVVLFDVSADYLLETESVKKAPAQERADVDPNRQALDELIDRMPPEKQQEVVRFARYLLSLEQNQKEPE